jgi:hypothetical protein
MAGWCCDLFSHAVSAGDRRGLSIRISKPEGPLPMGFLLSFRTLDPVGRQRLIVLLAGEELGATLECSQGILFCPWCGTDLRRFYGRRTDLPFSIVT